MKAQKLAVQLAEWETQGLITPEYQAALFDIKTAGDWPWVMYSFIMLGVTVVAVDVISFVAANWSMSLQGLNYRRLCPAGRFCACLCRFGDGANLLCLTPLRFFILFCFASTASTAHFYHSGGQPYRPCCCGVSSPCL